MDPEEYTVFQTNSKAEKKIPQMKWRVLGLFGQRLTLQLHG